MSKRKSTEFSWNPTTPEEHRLWWAENTEEPYGLCWCGCGERTTSADATRASRRMVRGLPQRFVADHSGRVSRPRTSWKSEDRGHRTPCWMWQNYLNAGGYGVGWRAGKLWLMHRYYYTRKYGPVTEGMELDHLCRVRACCNPDHVEPVTRAENVRRGANAKLTNELVYSIRWLHWERGIPRPELAKLFGVCVGSIEQIINRNSWKE